MIKAGQRLHNNHQIPSNAVIHKRKGREMYVSGISNNVRIRYLEDGTFEDVPYNEAKALYMPFCVEPIKNDKK